MPWGAKTQIATGLAVAGTELFSSAITLNPGESADIQIKGNSSGTTDNLVISAYGTLDASTENWDTVPFFQFALDCTDGNDNDVSFVVNNKYKFRLGFVRDGNSDTITTNAWERKDGINV